MTRAAVQVAGVCPAGHPVERLAELDQFRRPLLTWRGPCPAPGCGLHLIARRVKTSARKGADSTPGATITAPPPATNSTTTTTPATTPAPPATRRTVRKVTGYRDAPTQPKRERPQRPGSGEPARVSTAPLPAVAGPRLEPEPDEPGRPARRRRFSLGGRDARDVDGFVIPGIY